ncbi:MAG TPA: hypothetical protein V6C91_16615 [Coleofasciculaceae cyanobacterium]
MAGIHQTAGEYPASFERRDIRQLAGGMQATNPGFTCYQFNLAYSLFEKCDVLIIEELKLKNLTRRAKPKIDNNGIWLPNNQLAKSGLNKSMLNAAHGQFIQVLKFVAWKLGKTVKEVNPNGTSQHCWNCLNQVPK